MSFCQTDAFSVAVVGAGPTAVYFLNDLIKRAPGCSVTFFEAGEEAGRGMPYAMSHNDNGMLANIASIEIPPLRQTLSQWLSGLSDNIREEMGVSAHEDDEREFYPRVVLGRFFAAQFAMLVAAAEVQGFKVRVWDKTRVLDISPSASNVVIRYQGPTDEMCLKQFDAVMIATGHTWPGVTRDQAGVYHSPYPAWRLDHIHNCTVGIVGTGLSAIDAVYRIATNHGEFCAADHPDRLTYKPGRFADDLHITMMSRKGLLPEADFYCPLPYEPLGIFSETALQDMVEQASDQLLDRAFALFKQQLAHADPGYADQIHLSDLSVETFQPAYFQARQSSCPFAWAQKNLDEALANLDGKHTVAHLYTILRCHEPFQDLLEHMSDEDVERFNTHLKDVFIDNYAAVPAESIMRLLALHKAGKLDVLALGPEYEIEPRQPMAGVRIQYNQKQKTFDALVHAVGQRLLTIDQLPFPSLVSRLLPRARKTGPAATGRQLPPQVHYLETDEHYKIVSDSIGAAPVFCVAAPFLMADRPFIQGITASAEMAEAVADGLSGIVQDRTHGGVASTVAFDKLLHRLDQQ